MESEDNRDHLNKPALEKIVFSAFVMAGIDGHVDEDEVEVIRNFTSRHWKDEYGGIADFFDKIDKQVVEFFVPDKGKFDLKNAFITDRLSQLTTYEEKMLLNLMKDVMEADEIIDSTELSMIEIVRNYFFKKK